MTAADPHAEHHRNRHRWSPAEAGRAVARGLLLFLHSLWGLALFTVFVCSLALVPLGAGLYTTPAAVELVRDHAGRRRRWAGEWSGVVLPSPYRRVPDREGAMAPILRTRDMLADTATWRDVLWLLCAPVVGALIALFPAVLAIYPVWGVVYQFVWRSLETGTGETWFLFVLVPDQTTALVAIPLSVWAVPVLLRYGPTILDVDAHFAATLLGPTDRRRGEQRIDTLERSRADAVDASAAELRRVERDLHDGAQARLVVMGMRLDQVERLIDEDAGAAREVLRETRSVSNQALAELRELVRGISPPILADRGLGDALRSLTMESPLPMSADVDIPGRCPEPVESAAYFGVCEVLTNAAKHSGAGSVRLTAGHTDGRLRIVVSDDGAGGAEEVPGGGLAGIRRRLAAFDGTIAVHSRVGGPTEVVLEVPCALS